MRAAVATFFGIQSQVTTAAPAQLRAHGKTHLRTAILDYISIWSSGMLLPLHQIITIVLWNT